MSLEKPFDQIVGAGSGGAKEWVSQDFKKELETQEKWLAEYGKYERKKTEDEKLLIQLADQEASKVAEFYGCGQPPEFSEKAVHFIKSRYWQSKIGAKQGVDAIAYFENVVVQDKPFSKIRLLPLLFHEALHFKSFLKLEVLSREKDEIVYIKFKNRRGGLTFPIPGKRDKEISFWWLNEAVNQELTVRFFDQLMENPSSLIKEEVEILKETREFYKKDHPEKEITIGKKRKKFWGLGKSGRDVIVEKPLYEKERANLWKIVDDIYQKNPDRFEKEKESDAKEKIFTLFARAMFTGEILEPARLVEKTYGRGSFKELGKGIPEKKNS